MGAIISNTEKGLVASHYPVVVEEDRPGISVVSHVGRPDERAHELGRARGARDHPGAHGYISPGWYENTEFVPTWNHATAHLYGTPEILSDEENFEVLGQLVDHFERRLPDPVSLQIDEEAARHIATGTVGIRIPITRFDARLKLSQNKSPEVIEHIIERSRATDHTHRSRSPTRCVGSTRNDPEGCAPWRGAAVDVRIDDGRSPKSGGSGRRPARRVGRS